MMSGLGWIVSIVSSVGVVGALVLFFVAPQILAWLVKGALGIVEAILSTRLGVALLVGGVCLIAGDLFGDHNGYKRRVAVEVAQQTKILSARVVAHEKAAKVAANLAEMDAAVIEKLQQQVLDTPANAKAALPRDVMRRIGEIR